MKTLIVTIIAAIMAISLTGCTLVKEYHHARRPHHEVIVTRPWHPPVRHRHHVPRHFPGRHHPGPGRRHH